MTVRIIPRLDIKGPNLVKGIHLEGLRVLGRPEDFARHYYLNGADELIFMDVVASLYGRNSLHEIITKTAKEIFIPLAVGGGIRTIDDVKQVLRSGADKVVVNTEATRNPDFIKEVARVFGSSTIIVAIEAVCDSNGKYYAFTDNGRQETGLEVCEWAKKVENLGAGEILITSVDREGTAKGYDLKLIQSLSTILNIPIIAHGGVGRIDHITDAFLKTYVNAACIASMFHYSSIGQIGSRPDVTTEGNVEFLQNQKVSSKYEYCQISDVKAALIEKGIQCRN